MYYTASKHEPKFQSMFLYSSVDSMKRKNDILNVSRRPFEPFTLYLRVMENTGYDKVFGNPSFMYDMSRLSRGVKCAMQGCKYFGSGRVVNEIIEFSTSIDL